MKSLNLTLAVCAGLILSSPMAHADLMLFPTRVVLAGNQRAAQVELVNRGSKPETYRINLVNRRMTETGDIVAADEPLPGEQPATDLIRYSPRQVTLQPGVSQVLRITVRKPADLADGEYRSHLQFDRIPDADSASSLESVAQPGSGGIAVVLNALIGASIPAIVRHGQTSSSAALANLSVAPAGDGAPLLSFEIQRSGNASLFGDVRASFTPRGGKAVEVARADGVAVYVPNALRKARLSLKAPAGVQLADGLLHLSFLARPQDGGKALAEADLKLP